VAAVCCTAAGAGATSARFKLSVVAITHANWDHTTAPVEANGCTTSQRSLGVLTAVFHTRTPVAVRFTDGRIAGVDLGSLDGTADLAGTNTSNQMCGTSESHTPEPCTATTLTFRGVETHLSSTKPGSVTLGPLRGRPRTVDCPREPGELARDPLGPVPGPLRVSTRTLAQSRYTHITLTASASRRFKYGPREQGTLQQRTFWRVTLVRIRP
jgi:hypothetical protein